MCQFARPQNPFTLALFQGYFCVFQMKITFRWMNLNQNTPFNVQKPYPISWRLNEMNIGLSLGRQQGSIFPADRTGASILPQKYLAYMPILQNWNFFANSLRALYLCVSDHPALSDPPISIPSQGRGFRCAGYPTQVFMCVLGIWMPVLMLMQWTLSPTELSLVFWKWCY